MSRNDTLWSILRRMDAMTTQPIYRRDTVDELETMLRRVQHAQFLTEGSSLGSYRESLEILAARAIKALEDDENEQRS